MSFVVSCILFINYACHSYGIKLVISENIIRLLRNVIHIFSSSSIYYNVNIHRLELELVLEVNSHSYIEQSSMRVFPLVSGTKRKVKQARVRNREDRPSSWKYGLRVRPSVEDHGVVATDAKERKDYGKSNHRDPESSLWDWIACQKEIFLLSPSLTHCLISCSSTSTPGKLAGLDKWKLQK